MAEPRAAGTVIANRYVLDRQLGVGSFGQVWSAHDARAFNRPVAVKFLLEQHLTNVDVVERFWREGQATAALMHPNVVALLEVGEDQGVPYLVSEFVAGVPLRDLIDKRRESSTLVSVDEALAIFRQVCAGVTAAHDKEIVHRDLKPENVMIQGAGLSAHAKVLDFGIARMLSGQSKSTEAGRVMGSLFYMSPEQVLGDTQAVDRRSDAFALATLFFEMLTLKTAFEAETFHGVVGKILDPSRPNATPLRPDLPVELDAVFQRAFALRPRDRYDDVPALLDAFEQSLASASGRSTRSHSAAPLPLAAPAATLPSSPTLAAVPSPVADEPIAPAARSGPSVVLTASIVAVAVFAGAAGVALLRRPPSTPVQTTVTASTVPLPNAPLARAATAPRDTAPDDSTPWITLAAPHHAFVLGRGDDPALRHGFAPSSNIHFDGPAFRIQAHEVTWGAYEPWATGHDDREVRPPAWLPEDPHARADLPVVGVSWSAARAYCVALGGDLPSEEQWEYAARGEARRLAPWGNGPTPHALIAFRGTDGQLARVGSTEEDRTPEGVLDLAGNAQEWTASRFRADNGTEPAWTALLKTIRGLPPRDPPAAEVPPAGLYRNTGCTGDACSAGDRTALESVGFRCVRPGS